MVESKKRIFLLSLGDKKESCCAKRQIKDVFAIIAGKVRVRGKIRF